jgi:integrase
MSTLLAAHLRHIRAEGLAPRTVAERARLLAQVDRELPEGIDHATTDELATWLARDGWAAWTRVTFDRHLRAFYRWATGGRDPALDWNPMADLRRPRHPDADPHPATDEQVAVALARSSAWWQRCIVLCAYCGLRASEAAGLAREDVTETELRVRGKGGKTKVLPVHPEIWARVGPLPPGPLLPGYDGLPVRSLPVLARRHFDRIGLPGLHLHMLRHWFATMLLRGGTDIRTVQELMRHSSLTTTAGYLYVTDGQRRNAIATLPVLRSPLSDAA